MSVFTEHAKVVQVVAPREENLGTTDTAVIDISGHHECSFFIVVGTNAAHGRATVQAQACDDTTPTNDTAIAFKYRLTGSGNDIFGDLTDVAAGNTFTTEGDPSAGRTYEVVIDPSVVAAATVDGTTGHRYVRLELSNTVAQNSTHTILAVLDKPRYKGSTQATVLP